MGVSAVANPSESRLTIKDVLAPNAILARMELSAKKDILQDVARRAAVLAGKDEHIVFDVLWARERLGTTGVGQGIAIPHGRVPGLDHVCGFFVRMAEPIAFEAIDDKPVDLVFTLLSPEDAGADHLQALATVSRLLRDPELCKKLRAAKDEAAIYKILTEATTAQAA